MDNNLVQNTIVRYHTLAEDMDVHYKCGDTYRQRLYAALRSCGARVARHVAKLEAAEEFRIAGDDTIDVFMNAWRLDTALRIESAKSDPKKFWWLQRAMLTSRLHTHRALSYFQVRYTLDASDVDVMIKLGEIYQFLHKHTGMAVTYSDFYLSKGNPYGLKKLAPDLIIADENGEKTTRIFGVASIAGEQGGERFNAWHKMMYPLLTNGKAGSEELYLEAIYAVRGACASGDFPTNATPAITQNRRQRWPDDKPPTAAAASTTSCACGCPSSGVDFDRLKREVQCAGALHLVKGKRACPTCHDCLEVIFELARDKPTGVCEKVIKILEFVRVKEAAQVRFDVDAEKRRVRSVIAECELAKQAACARTAEVEEEDSDESSSDDGSSLSDDSHMLDLA
jgi:hypothetical protein